MGVKLGHTLVEERRLRVFENGVLRGIFGAERDKITGEWRKLHHEELNDLYSSLNIECITSKAKVVLAYRRCNNPTRDRGLRDLDNLSSGQ